MSKARILVVEDENVVAKDIQHRLMQLGYSVPYTVASGEEALRVTRDMEPDLILMDIHLSKGFLSGIDAAEAIHRRFDVPIIFVTGRADRETLDQAKLSNAFGFVTKPVQVSDLRISIEMAIHKHRRERNERRRTRWAAASAEHLNAGLIAVDGAGSIQFMNRAAERLTGWNIGEAMGMDLQRVCVFQQMDGEPTGSSSGLPISWAPSLLQKRGGHGHEILLRTASISGGHGVEGGRVVLLVPVPPASARSNEGANP